MFPFIQLLYHHLDLYRAITRDNHSLIGYRKSYQTLRLSGRNLQKKQPPKDPAAAAKCSRIRAKK
jgi:hypothetical protein